MSSPTLARLFARAVRRFPNRTALMQGARRWSYAALEADVAALSAHLAERLPQGARVGLFMNNCADYLLLQLALERAGLVRVPMNAKLTSHEARALIEDCGAAAVFCDVESFGKLNGAACWLCPVDGGKALNGADYGSLKTPPASAGLAALASRAVSPGDLASINYTSGSSGKPKGVMLTHGNWLAVTRNMLLDRDFRKDDIAAHIGPLSHASGTYAMPWFLRGACNLIVENGVDGLLEAIEHRGVTAFTCVPTVLTRIVNHPRAASLPKGALRMIGYGAEPIPRNTLDKALALFGPILTQNYGLTEAMMTCVFLSPEDHFDASGAPRVGCIGRPYSYVEIVARAPDGTPVATGEIGELTFRADHIMLGYWGLAEETAKVLRDGWLWSGDLGRIDADGLVSLTGRSKEMLISGGFNIYPQEIEAVLTSLADVAEAAVIGLPDADWGEIAIAIVSPVPGAVLSAESLRNGCRDRLGIKTPKRFVIAETLPKNPNGKVDKGALRRQFSEEAADA